MKSAGGAKHSRLTGFIKIPTPPYGRVGIFLLPQRGVAASCGRSTLRPYKRLVICILIYDRMALFAINASLVDSKHLRPISRLSSTTGRPPLGLVAHLVGHDVEHHLVGLLHPLRADTTDVGYRPFDILLNDTVV